MARTLIGMPSRARRGEVIEVKTLIAHPMETGYRRDATGNLVKRDIIRRFACVYGGVEVFAAELHPAVAANPFVAFALRAEASGPVEFRWTGDDGFAQTERVQLAVE